MTIAGAKLFAEKPTMLTSGAEALVEEEGFIAALKALRHPKAEFFSETVKPRLR